MDTEKGQREANVADESKLIRVIMRIRTVEGLSTKSDWAMKWHVSFNLDKHKAMDTEKNNSIST